jgi:hypothetical protein
MGVLKVKTTVEFVGTPVAPLAGTLESRAGCAWARQKQKKKPANTIHRDRRFDISIPCPSTASILYQPRVLSRHKCKKAAMQKALARKRFAFSVVKG